MAECEVCGRESPLYTVEIDRARLRVCFDCSKSGKLIEAPRQPARKERQGSQAGPAGQSVQRPKQQTEFELVSDYSEKIKASREKMHITRDVLSEMINEKESFLERIESGRALPTELLGKKLERALGISLYEEVGTGSEGFSRGERRSLTLGDVINVKKKREAESED